MTLNRLPLLVPAPPAAHRYQTQIIAANLPADEICGLREMFMSMDADNNGSITIEEFTHALKRKGKNLNDEEVQRLVADADVDGDGTIDYEVRAAAAAASCLAGGAHRCGNWSEPERMVEQGKGRPRH